MDVLVGLCGLVLLLVGSRRLARTIANVPDLPHSLHGMGWQRLTFKDDTILIWHNGAIEGFTTYMGFLPQHDLGIVVLNNINTAPTGIGFYLYVLNVLLNQQLGLNMGVPAKALEFSDTGLDGLQQLGRQARAVDFKAVAPYLGYYSDGYALAREGGDLVLRITSRVMPLRAMPDGTYLIASGLILGTRVKLALEADGTPHIEIVGVQTVRRSTAPAPCAAIRCFRRRRSARSAARHS